MKNLEIERRFLLYPCSMKRFLKLHGIDFKSVAIEQFYLEAKEGEVLRYRRRGESYFRTIKSGIGLVRSEFEEEVSEREFEEALERNRGGVIRKRRYIFKVDGLTFELDMFKKPLRGLNVLEVEFKSEDDAEKFELPPFFKKITVAEVTQNPSFSNGAISKSMRIPTLEKPLHILLEEVEKRDDFLKASVSATFGAYESTLHALQTVIYSLLKTIDRNKGEILSHTKDPERLHQLRVAMRKIRALFSVCKDMFDAAWLQSHKEKMRRVMGRTGDMRDIDVYLAEMDEYRKLLPKELHPGLNRLEHYLLQKQKQQRKKLESFLRSEEFLKEMEELALFAKTERPQGAGEEALSPVIIPVKRALKQRYKKVLKKGGEIEADSAAHEYHMVRIEVKKLRYLMEFFHSVFDEEAYEKMLASLKSIQSILGKHQDLDVQREHLKQFYELEELHDEKTQKALKSLMDQMQKMQNSKRAEFRREFKEFAKTGRLFRKMICKF